MVSHALRDLFAHPFQLKAEPEPLENGLSKLCFHSRLTLVDVRTWPLSRLQKSCSPKPFGLRKRTATRLCMGFSEFSEVRKRRPLTAQRAALNRFPRAQRMWRGGQEASPPLLVKDPSKLHLDKESLSYAPTLQSGVKPPELRVAHQ